MIGVNSNNTGRLLNTSSEKTYLDRVLTTIEEGLVSGGYYSEGVARWLDLENTTLEVFFISWQRGSWGAAIPGTYLRPFKHPDQAILANSFSDSVVFIILDSPGILPVTPQTPEGSGALGVHDINGIRAFGDGTAINPAFNAIETGGNSVIFYHGEKKEGTMYYSYDHRYNFISINRPVEIGLTQVFFEYITSPPITGTPTAYSFLNAYGSAISYRYRFIYKSNQQGPGAFVISNSHDQPVNVHIHGSLISTVSFFSPPAVGYNLTLTDCEVDLVNLNDFAYTLADFNTVTLTIRNCSISSLGPVSITDFLAFLNEYDFWYNGIRYTSLDVSSIDLDPLDDRYFTRTVVTTAGLAYDIADTDIGLWRQFTSNGAVSVTINSDSLATTGDVAAIEYLGTGSLSLVAGAGVTLQVNENKSLISDGQYSAIFIKKTAADTYRVFGELTPI